VHLLQLTYGNLVVLLCLFIRRLKDDLYDLNSRLPTQRPTLRHCCLVDGCFCCKNTTAAATAATPPVVKMPYDVACSTETIRQDAFKDARIRLIWHFLPIIIFSLTRFQDLRQQ